MPPGIADQRDCPVAAELYPLDGRRSNRAAVIGVELTTVSKWLGHASLTVTLNIYSHYVGDVSDFVALERLARKKGE